MRLRSSTTSRTSSRADGSYGPRCLETRDARFCAPAFLIIGFGRCGTTALAKYLSGHPWISHGARKEHANFNRALRCDLRSGANAGHRCLLQTYARQFPVTKNKDARSAPRNVTFDATVLLGSGVSAACSERTVEWLRSRLPALKLLVVIKSPADRFLADAAQAGWTRERLQAALEYLGTPAIVQDSDHAARELEGLLEDHCYVDQLAVWLAHFDASRFLLIKAEDLRRSASHRQRILDDVHTFLGVPPHAYAVHQLTSLNTLERAGNSSFLPRVRSLVNCLPRLRQCESKLEAVLDTTAHPLQWCPRPGARAARVETRVEMPATSRRARDRGVAAADARTLRFRRDVFEPTWPLDRGAAANLGAPLGADWGPRCYAPRERDGGHFLKFCAPSFLIIGFGRCGTTSLAKYLSSHPRISFGQRKEHFNFYRDQFCDLQHGPNNGTGCSVEAYARQFPVTKTKRRADVTFDATPMLGGDMGVPASHRTMAWLRSRLPDLKLLVMVKSPADRFLSNPLASAKISRLQDSLVSGENAMPRKLRQIMNDNCYVESLTPWLEYFDSDRFLLIRAEQLRDTSQRQGILDEVHDFLGVEPFRYAPRDLEYEGNVHRASNTTLSPEARAAVNCLPSLERCEQRLEDALDQPNALQWCAQARAYAPPVALRSSEPPLPRPSAQPVATPRPAQRYKKWF